MMCNVRQVELAMVPRALHCGLEPALALGSISARVTRVQEDERAYRSGELPAGSSDDDDEETDEQDSEEEESEETSEEEEEPRSLRPRGAG
jgi:hypothetical protein